MKRSALLGRMTEARHALWLLEKQHPGGVPEGFQPRKRFLEIQALGGPLGLEAALQGLRLRGASARSSYSLSLLAEEEDEAQTIFIWLRKLRYVQKGLPEAEVYQTWPTKGKRRTLFAGTRQECLAWAADWLRAEEARLRLGAE